MQQLAQGYGIHDWRRIRRYAGRMETLSEEATVRVEALKFWDKHGLEASRDFSRYPDAP